MGAAIRLLSIIGSCLVAFSSACAQLQLKPSPSSYEVDGIKFSQLSFHDGNKEVTYVPPHGWECAGNESSLALRPPKQTQAEASIVKVPLTEEAPFDEPTQKKLTDLAMASLPSGRTNVKVVSQDLNPVMIDRKETFSVTMSYNAYGDTYARSMMFMNRGKEQIRFQLTSRLSDFAELQRAFLQSQFSWRNL